MAILESDGWKYYAEFVKAYAPNATGQTLNNDPTLTVLEIDNTPLRCNIPGLTVAASNRIPLPQDLEYFIEAQTILTSYSTNQFAGFPILWNATDSNLFTSGDENMTNVGSVYGTFKVSTQIEKLTAQKLLEFQFLKNGYAGAASDVVVGRSYPSAPLSNSTAGLDLRTRIKIWAK